jgi:superfamily II DNA or RNA helicase
MREREDLMHQDLFAALEPAGASVTAPPELDLRWYQQAAREAVAAIHGRSRGALICHPTGTGKSRTAGAVAWDHRLRGSKVLILCPTITLTRQMYSDMRKLGLSGAIEQADNRTRRPLPDVVVACVASMRGQRLASFGRGDFGLVIADEAHRSASPNYGAIFAHFEGAKLLGLTATPDRTDGVSLRNVFDELAHEMTMLQAISEGWLVPLRFKTAVTDFDPKAIRTLAGEVDPASVAKEITRSGLLHEAANTLAELAEGERTVAFLPTVAASKAFVAELLARNVSATHIDGTTPDTFREQAFQLFTSGQVRVLCNVGVLTEGWDCPSASVVALLNPTKSRSRLTQMIGRGTRLAPGKASTLVIDFCPGRMKKGRLASPADALAGRMLDDAVYDHLPKAGDLAEAIKTAERTVEDIEARKRKAEEAARRKAERLAELKKHATKRAFSYDVEEHDAGAILSGTGAANDYDRRSRQRVAGPTPEEQVDIDRRKAGLCSTKQSLLLKKRGLNPDLPRELAKTVIDAIATNGWRVPENIKTNPRFRPVPPPKPEVDATAVLKRLGFAT